MTNPTLAQLRRMGASVREQGPAGVKVATPRAPRFSGPVSQAKARQRLNKWEQQYRDLLEVQKRGGLILDYWSQAIRLHLADNTTYTPDFLVAKLGGGLQFVEIKGRKHAAGMAKYKIAREKYCLVAEFVMIAKTGDGWIVL